jgi:hypothetical protein
LRDRVSLCINSFPTAKGGIVARLVDVGDGGAAASYASVEVKGAVVLGDAEVGPLWRQAVKERGAIGVISTRIASYIRPADPKAFTAPDQQDVLQWGTIPYDSDVKGFGFTASYRAAARMRERLKNGPVDVRIVLPDRGLEQSIEALVADETHVVVRVEGDRLVVEQSAGVPHG